MTSKFLSGLAAAIMCVSAKAQFATSIEAIPIPMGSESGRSLARAVNFDGAWVVGSVIYWLPDGMGSRASAFRYNVNHGVILLGGTEASAVSADGGTVVGRASSGGASFACRWVAPGFNVVPMGYANQISAISASGSVVVGTSGFFAAVGPTQQGMSVVGALPLHTVSSALAVSAGGEVVVGFSKPGVYGGGERGFVWTSRSGVSPLSNPAGLEQNVVATALNGIGNVVVGYAESGEANSRRAIRWGGLSSPAPLPLPAGFQTSSANGISSSGEVIVGSGLLVSDGGERAVIWTETYGARALSDVLSASGIDVSTWVLESATAVSGDGSTIVGNGRFLGVERAFVIRGFRSPPDSDGDAVPDFVDNCPSIANPSQADCDLDGIGDACEPSSDINQNGIPDSCECIADLFVDQLVNGVDLGVLLGYWGPTTSASASQRCDLNRDGAVDGVDLGYLLSRWGACTS